jgi:hypothetical protein
VLALDVAQLAQPLPEGLEVAVGCGGSIGEDGREEANAGLFPRRPHLGGGRHDEEDKGDGEEKPDRAALHGGESSIRSGV